MRTRNLILVALVLIVVAGLFISRTSDQTAQPQPGTTEPVATPPAPQAVAPAVERVPPYYSEAEAAGRLPTTLSASEFKAYPIVARAYRIAERIPTVLAQQPCYCWCDKFGHGNLLDCFATDHGAG